MRMPALEFRARPAHLWFGQHESRTRRWLAVGALACAGLAAIAAGITVLSDLSALDATRAERARVDSERAAALSAPRQAAPVLTRDQLHELNELVRRLNTPWRSIFQTLERQTPANVALVSIEPDTTRQTVRIEAEARRLDELLAYVERLRTDAAIDRVLLVEHATNERDPTRPVRLKFELVFLERE